MNLNKIRKSTKIHVPASLCIVILACLCKSSALGDQQIVTVNFDQSEYRDYTVYIEHGFTLTPNVGAVRVNDAFPPGSMAAQPSFGFGQGMDSSFTFSNQLQLPFTALSIDLLEATGDPATFSVTMIGTRANSSIVTQTFTLDGIEGAQTFTFLPEFTNLVSLKIAKDPSDLFYIDIVQIDNVRFIVPLSGTPIRTRTGIYGQSFVTNLSDSASSLRRIPATTLVSIYDSHSRLVKRCVSSPVGQFYAYLRPGDYVIVGRSMGDTGDNGRDSLGRRKRWRFISEPVNISVFANEFSPLELTGHPIEP